MLRTRPATLAERSVGQIRAHLAIRRPVAKRPAIPRIRARGAGRPAVRGASKRSSARSGDSGDDSGSAEGDGEPPARPVLWLVDSEFARVNRAMAAFLREVRR